MTGDQLKRLYVAIDSLQISLDSNGIVVEGQQDKIANIGPIKMNFRVTVKGDAFTETELGMFIHFRGELWGYLHVTQPGVGPQLVLRLFKSKNKTCGEWRHYDPAKTLALIAPITVAEFVFNGETWASLEAPTVLS
jgi:hypothetical protein